MNKDLLEFLKSRRSIRAFRSEQIAADALDAVLDAGVYAPPGMGKQSPAIVAVRDRETRERISRMNAQVMGGGGDPYYGAPTILLVFGAKKAGTCVKDACNVLTYLLLAAHAAGLCAVLVDREQEMFETEEGKALRKEWGLSDDWIGVGAVALGYAEGEAPQPAARKKDYVVKVV